MKNNKKKIFTYISLLVLCLVTIFSLWFFWNMVTENLVSATVNNNNVVVNNQISPRDINNVVSTVTDNNSNSVYNNTGSSTGWILPVFLWGGAALIVTLIGISFCVGALDAPTTAAAEAEAIEMNIIN